MLSGLGDKMAHPVTSVSSACIRWETRFTRRADMACPASLSSLSLPGFVLEAWPIELQQIPHNSDNGGKKWLSNRCAVLLCPPSPSLRSRQPREIIKCWQRTGVERIILNNNSVRSLYCSTALSTGLRFWNKIDVIIMSCILIEETLLYYKLCWYVIVGVTHLGQSH